MKAIPVRESGNLAWWPSFILIFAIQMGAAPSGLPQSTHPPLLRIVDEISFSMDKRAGVGWIHSAIAVDSLNEIVQLRWEEKPDHSVSPKEITRYLAQAAEDTGLSDLQTLLPKGMIPSEVRRFRSGKFTYHFLIGWSFDQRFRQAANIVYSLLVFVSEEGSGQFQMVYSEEYINDELEGFFVRDLSQDGTLAIIDRGRGARDQKVTVRVLGSAGKVSKLQTFEAYDISLSLNYPASGYEIFLEDNPQTVRGGVPVKSCSELTVYNWSSKDKKFILYKGA